MKTLVLLVSTAAIMTAAELHTAPSSGLTVHEWGTFTSVAGEDGAAVLWDTLASKDDLPFFVNNFGSRCSKWRLTGTVRMETPVIYFYSPREIDVHVKVAFPQGIITEWYPQADHQVFQKRSDGSLYRLPKNLSGIDTSLLSMTGGIEWTNVKVQPDAAPVLPVEAAASHYYAARSVDAAPVSAGSQQEKFLFYRGVGRFNVPLSARIAADGKVVVENQNSDPIPTLILFVNGHGKLGFRNVGSVEKANTIDSPSLDGNFAQLRNDLETALTAQGLYPKEAAAMVETWKDSWFEEGSRLIYIVPSRMADAVLPLEIKPAPSTIARVFVGRIELITPAMTQTVAEAVVKRDWPVLSRYGRFLDPILSRIAAEHPEMSRQVLDVSSQARGLVNCR